MKSTSTTECVSIQVRHWDSTTPAVLAMVILLFAGVLSGPASASAEDAGARKVRQSNIMEEIVVTANKREQNILDAAVAVQNFSGDALEENGIRNAFDLANAIPGALATFSSQPTTSEIYLRGAGASSWGRGGFKGDRTTGVYVDDTPMVYPNQQRLPPMPMFDLERVEVLRGPQGTTYGAGSMGGTIKYITRQPDLERFGGKVQMAHSDTQSASSANTRIDAVVNIPIVQNKFGVRIYLQDESRGGVGTVRGAPEIDDPGAYDTRAYRIKARWDVNDDLSMTASHWRSTFDQTILRSFASTDPIELNPVNPNFLPNNDTEFVQSTLTIALTLPFAQLTSNTQLTGDDQHIGPNKRNPAGKKTSTAESKFSQCAGGEFEPVSCVAERVFGNTVHGWSEEIRLVSNTPGPFQWIAGVQYIDINNDGDAQLIYNPPLENQNFFQVNLLNTKSWAIFGEASYGFLDDKLVALMGLRYYEDDRSQPEYYTGIRDGEYVDGLLINNEKSFDSVNPRFNISYFPSDRGMVYFNAAKGFRSGTVMRQYNIQALIFAGVQGIGSETIADGDTVWSYEVGSKWTFLDGRLIAQGALYMSQWEDLQSRVGVQYVLDGVTRTAGNFQYNIGDADVMGLEWDLQFRATDGLTLSLNGALTGSEYTRISDLPAVLPPTQLQVGKDVVLIPKRTLSFTARYHAPLANTGWNINLNGVFAYRSSPINEFGVGAESAYRSVNLRAGVEKDRWQIQLFAENATNFDKRFNAGSATTSGGQILDPRTIGLSLRYAME